MEAHFHALDVSKTASVKKFIMWAKSKIGMRKSQSGNLPVLINNAGGRRVQYTPDLFTTAGLNFVGNNKPDQFYDEVYRLPADLLKGKQAITVKFQAQPGAWAGGVFGARVMKTEAAK